MNYSHLMGEYAKLSARGKRSRWVNEDEHQPGLELKDKCRHLHWTVINPRGEVSNVLFGEGLRQQR